MARPIQRVRNALRDPRGARERLRLRLRLLHMGLLNVISRRPAVSRRDVVVSVTSYGVRLKTVYAALESIARGTIRPGRLILWVAQEEADAPRHDPRLARLRRRGLEVIACPDFGPHKKQFPFASAEDRGRAVLVTGDDDKFYPRNWLAGLLAEAKKHPRDLLGYRAHLVELDGAGFAPYATWREAPTGVSSYAILCTGVGGVLLPPALLDALAREGDAFRERAPRADDLWVHAVAVRAGIRSRQVASPRRDLDSIPASQATSLYSFNVRRGGNDAQLALSHGGPERDRIRSDRLTGPGRG